MKSIKRPPQKTLPHVPRNASPTIEACPAEGRLLVESGPAYAIFIASKLGEASLIHGYQYHTYGLIEAPNIHIASRTKGNRWEIQPGSEVKRYEVHRNTLMVPKEDADLLLEQIGVKPHPKTDSQIDAERLYNAFRGRHFGGVIINACGTFSIEDGRLDLDLRDAAGGISIGSSTLEVAAQKPSFAHA